MYIKSNIFKVDFDNLTDWTDGDTNGAVSEIDPAGQLHLDCISMTATGYAKRSKDLGTVGSGNYYVEVRFKGDTWDYLGSRVLICAGTNFFQATFKGSDAGNNGIYIYDGATDNKVLAKDWDNNWHTVVFYIHNSQTDCDIWVDKSPSESADVTDADCSTSTFGDGYTELYGYGTVAGNGEYHVDYVYVGDDVDNTSPLPTFKNPE